MISVLVRRKVAPLIGNTGLLLTRGMAGHSKWHNIKRQKGARDQERGKITTSYMNKITSCARAEGADPATNPTLRSLIEQARRENVNKARITAALARITGRIEDGDHAVMETLAHGIGIMTEIITSNLKRTLQEVRIETKNTGIPFGVVGACKWMFEEKTIVALEQKRLSEELQMEAREATESDEVGEALLTVAMDAGAQDVRVNSETGDVELVCAPDEAAQVRATVADTLGLPVTDMYMAWVPRERVECASEQVRAEVEDFVQQVGENPDVVRVFHNANWKTN